MKIIGLDLGSRTCGVASSDDNESMAFGVKTLRFPPEDYETAVDIIKATIVELKGEAIVVGLPKHLNGDIGERGRISQKLAEILAEELSITVELWDERFTTVAAERLLISADVSRKKRKEVIDTIAAVYILKSYLDAKKNRGERNDR